MLRLVSRVSFVFLAVLVAGAGCGDDKGKMLPGVVIDGGADSGGATACGAVFLSPADLSTLTASDDKDGDFCKAGFQTDVELAVAGSANGTTATLYAAGAQVGTAVVSGGRLTFVNVQLAAQGSVALSVQVGTGATGCMATSTVMVDCNVPTCSITKPVLSEAKAFLNSADRSSAEGSDYQVAFEVTTSLADGKDVQLEVAQSSAPTVVTTLTAKAMGGKATFPGVTLRPDGSYVAQAICTDANGVKGSSAKGTYPVDTAAPALDVTSPVDMKHFNPADLMNGKFQVCASTTSADAFDLPAANMNLCAGIGSASPICGSVAKAGAGGSGCVSLDCPGGAPFNLTVTLKDTAGNPTTKTIQAVTCASTLPSVQIVSPAGDSSPFSDVSKHLLAANAGTAFVDSDAVAAGAQATVVACTNRAGKARLMAGRAGGNLAMVGQELTVVAAVASDNCPSGLGFVARWTGATLPQSTEDAVGALTNATQLKVEVTDVSTALGTSPAVDLWVDTDSPNITNLRTAAGAQQICGKTYESAVNVTENALVTTTNATVSLAVQGPSMSATYSPSLFAGSVASIGPITFYVGESTITATVTEPSGNKASLAAGCKVKVGTAPVVTWLAPSSGQQLCAAGNNAATCVADGDAAAGWQGTLRVQVRQGGNPVTTGTVTFYLGTTVLGTVNIDGTGTATLSNVSIADGQATLEARTSDIGGVGTASQTVTVDTNVPTTATALVAQVKNRRQTSFSLTWKAPADGAVAVTGYAVRVSDAVINAGNFESATVVPFTGAPAAPGADESLDVLNRPIEKDQYFAVAAVDALGNRGPLITAGPVSAKFNRTIIAPPGGAGANERFGAYIDGLADLDGDGYTDILVTSITGTKAYIFFGAANVDDLADPAKQRVTVVNGPSGTTNYGRAFIDAGDLDGDGKSDIAISASRAGNGRIYILRGRSTWAASYDVTVDSDFIIELDANYATTRFGEAMARLGNFDGAGADDLAIGVGGFAGGGRALVIFGGVGGLVPPVAAGTVALSAANLSMAILAPEAAETTGNFGDRVLGMSYTGGSSNTLLVSAINAGSNAGKVYAFSALAASPTPVVAGTPVSVGVGTTAFYGNSLAVVGSIGGASAVAIAGTGNVGLGASAIAAQGYVDLFAGSAASVFTGTKKTFYSSTASVLGNNFGRITLGSGFSGSSLTANVVGDSDADMVFAPWQDGMAAASLIVVDGSVVSGFQSITNVSVNPAATLALPADWKKTSLLQRQGLLRDLNNDGAADIGVGEYDTTNTPGRVAIFW